METGREFRLLLTGSDSKMLIWGGGPGGGAMPCKKKGLSSWLLIKGYASIKCTHHVSQFLS